MFRTDENVDSKCAFSHRPLENDEFFQIKIDRLDPGESLAMLFHVGLVAIRDGTTKEKWTLMSSQILLQGKPLKKFDKLDLNTLRVDPFINIWLCQHERTT